MREVNVEIVLYWCVSGDLIDGSEEGPTTYAGIDPNNEQVMKEIICKEILPGLPEFSAHVPLWEEEFKLAFMYCLTVTEHGQNSEIMTSFDLSLHDVIIAIDAPDNPRDYFLWCWEVFFPGEDYHLQDTDQYELVFEIVDTLCYENWCQTRSWKDYRKQVVADFTKRLFSRLSPSEIALRMHAPFEIVRQMKEKSRGHDTN